MGLPLHNYLHAGLACSIANTKIFIYGHMQYWDVRKLHTLQFNHLPCSRNLLTTIFNFSCILSKNFVDTIIQALFTKYFCLIVCPPCTQIGLSCLLQKLWMIFEEISNPGVIGCGWPASCSLTKNLLGLLHLVSLELHVYKY